MVGCKLVLYACTIGCIKSGQLVWLLFINIAIQLPNRSLNFSVNPLVCGL